MWSRRVASFGFSLVVGLGSAAFLTSCEPGPECTGRWVGPVGGAFSTPSNWEGGAVPTGADRICAPEGASIVVDEDATIASADVKGAIVVPSASTLTVTGAEGSRVAALKLSGTLDGAGLVEVGMLKWTGGTMAGTGRTDVSASTPVALADDIALEDSRTLYLRNTVDWTGGGISMCGDSVLGIFGTLDAAGPDATIGSKDCRSVVDPRVFVTGTFDVRADTTVHATLINFGAVTVDEDATLAADAFEQRPSIPVATTDLGSGATLAVGGGNGEAKLGAGTLTGSGTVDGDVTGVVAIAPGPPEDDGTGILSVTGDLTPAAGSTLAIDIAGTLPGTGHDQLVVGGTAELAAVDLITDLTDSYTPVAGDVLELVAASPVVGPFATAPPIDDRGLRWQLSYPATRAVLSVVANQAPLAEGDEVSIKEDTAPNPVFADVLANDTDADGDTLTVTNGGTLTLAHGTLILNANGTYAFALDDANPAVNALNDGQNLTDSFTYVISDGHGGTTSADITVTIYGTNEANRAPIANNDSVPIDGYGQQTVSDPGLLANDIDPDGDALTVVPTSPVTANGIRLQLYSDGSFTITPGINFSGLDSFTYSVTDGLATTQATVTLNGVHCTSPAAPGVDWSGCDQTARGLLGADLTGANLAGAKFDTVIGVNMEGADLTGTTFDRLVGGSNFHNAKMDGTELRVTGLFDESVFSGVRSGGITGTPGFLPSPCRLTSGFILCSRVNLSGADLSGVDLSGAELYRANVAGADLTGADLRGTKLREAKLAGANFTGADLRGANVPGTDFTGADLTRADLTGVHLDCYITNKRVCTTLKGANVTGALMAGIEATGLVSGGITGEPATLPSRTAVRRGYLFAPRIDLSGADLSEFDLTGLDLSGANLRASALGGSMLAGATLDGTGSGQITGTPATLPLGWRFSNGYLLGVGCNLTDGAELTNLELARMDLHGCTMRSAKLSGLNLQGANLTGVILTGASLTNPDFGDANLTNVRLDRATMTGANLQGADLTGIELAQLKSSGLIGTPGIPAGHRVVRGQLVGARANLAGADLSGEDLSHLPLDGIDLTGANLRNADLTGTGINGAAIEGTDVTGATLRGLRSWGVNGTPVGLPAGWIRAPSTLIGPYAALDAGVSLASADMRGLDLNHTRLSGVIFTHADLSGANLSNADLSGANMERAKLGGANLDHADLTGARLYYTDLNHVDASYATFNGVASGYNDFSNAVLAHAMFKSATSPWSDYTGADLRNVDFSRTGLWYSNFTSANLTGANLYLADWQSSTWGSTTCPNGAVSESNYACSY